MINEIRQYLGCSRLIVPLSLLVLTVLASGCQSTSDAEVKPFTKFAESTASLRDGTDAAITNLLPKSVASYKEKMLESLDNGDLSELENAQLTLKSDDPYTFKFMPSYMIYDQFRLSLLELTQGMHQYSLSLAQLVGGEIQSEEEFTKFANDLNANSLEAYATIKESSGENASKNIAIFSTAASVLFSNYLKNKKFEALVEGIETNQATVDEYASRVAEALSLVRQTISNRYLEESDKLRELVLDSQKRTAAIDALINLNRQYYTEIQALRLLNETINKFPEAHKNLITATKSGTSISSILELVSYGTRLKSIADNAKQANENTLLNAQATKVEEKAVALETDAKLASLDAASARADAVIAYIEVEASPSDKKKLEVAKQLEAIAISLEEIAKTKTKAAKLAREAADAVKSSTDALTK